MILSNYKKLNITFCGMMGSGKSLIGKKFAKLIGFKFIDTDSLIEEKTGKSINQLFNDFGEGYFRKVEETTICKILNKKDYIFSLGGGSMNNNNIRNLIKKTSFNIYLEVKIDILVERLINSKNRPLIKNNDIRNKLFELINKREKYYKQANLIIKNENKISNTINKLKNYFEIYD